MTVKVLDLLISQVWLHLAEVDKDSFHLQILCLLFKWMMCLKEMIYMRRISLNKEDLSTLGMGVQIGLVKMALAIFLLNLISDTVKETEVQNTDLFEEEALINHRSNSI